MKPILAATLLALASPAASAHCVLVSPDGGEVLAPGEVITIEWQISIPHDLQDWDLWYSTTGPAGPWIPIAMDLPPGSSSPGVPHTFDWTVPDAPSSQVRVRVRMDNSGADYYDESDGDLEIVDCGVTSYCVAAPNSSGAGALLSATGTTRVAANDLVLSVAGASSSQPGLFFYGPQHVQVVFGDGFRCVGSGGVGTFRLGPAVVTDPGGAAQRPLDLTAPPASAGPGAIGVAETWNFQFWYRDPGFGTAGFNLSDAIAATFCP